MRGLLRRPTRGGWLTLLNCAAWACLAMSTEDGTLPGGVATAVVVAVFFLSLPLALPLIAGYAFHKKAYEGRDFKRFAEIYADVEEPVA